MEIRKMLKIFGALEQNVVPFYEVVSEVHGHLVALMNWE
jgi:uncharacterized membrane protein YagU involved in acid resistance